MDIQNRSKRQDRPRKAEEMSIIYVLAKRFPFGISLDPRLVVPLSTSTFHDIQRVMGITGEEAAAYQRALHHYERSTAYLRAVALGGKRHSLWGEPLSDINQLERSEARKVLLKRGRWSNLHENLYRTRMGERNRLDSLPEYQQLREARQASHEERLAKWIERLHSAGFDDSDIARIQQHGINTKDLSETRQALDALHSV